MDILDRLDGAFTSTGRAVAKVTPDRYAAATPCADWDLRALLNHTTGVVARFEAAAGRRQFEGRDDADWVGVDPRATFEGAAKATLATWSEAGALDGTCRLSSGVDLPAEVAAGINFMDTLVHGWDISVALGVDPTLDPTLAAAAIEISRLVVRDDNRGPGKGFGIAVPATAGASPTDELVAFLGRRS